MNKMDIILKDLQDNQNNIETLVLMVADMIKKSRDSQEDILYDEMATVLDVTGGNLDIKRVNPIGDNKIYNFSYYMNEGHMSKELIKAITKWQDKIDRIKDNYIRNYTEYLLILEDLNEINESCKVENNFSETEMKELNSFMMYADYENKAFSHTSNMTHQEKEDISKLLYQQGEIKLKNVHDRFKSIRNKN